MSESDPFMPAFVDRGRPSLDFGSVNALATAIPKSQELPYPIIDEQHNIIRLFTPDQLSTLGNFFAANAVFFKGYVDRTLYDDSSNPGRFFTRAVGWLQACEYRRRSIVVEDLREQQVSITLRNPTHRTPRLTASVTPLGGRFSKRRGKS